jgi:hypothetical protein
MASNQGNTVSRQVAMTHLGYSDRAIKSFMISLVPP